MAAEQEEGGPQILKGVVVSETGQVKVWASVGFKIPIPDIEYGMFEVNFGHERWARSGSAEDIRNASRLVDEYNEQQIDRLLRKYLRQLRRIDREESSEGSKRRKKKGKGGKSAIDRIRDRT